MSLRGCLLLLCAGCANTNVRATAASTEPVGDLPTALPLADSTSNRAEAGNSARLLRNPRREQVLELFRRFLGAFAHRNAEEISPLLDETVVGNESAQAVRRDQIVQYHARIMMLFDTSGVEAVYGGTPTVATLTELSRQGHTIPISMRPGDWLVIRPSASGNTSPIAMNLVPRYLVVRWRNDRPVIVGVPEAWVQQH